VRSGRSQSISPKLARLDPETNLVDDARGTTADDVLRFVETTSREKDEMSIFPTKILLATDGSSEAELATRTAVDLAQKTGSELHMIHVLDVAQIAMVGEGTTDPMMMGLEELDPILEERLEQLAEQRGKEVLDTEVERARSAGGTVAQAHLKMGGVAREIVHLAEDLQRCS
jgi:nucleotide-binding universal stress UspA family protein